MSNLPILYLISPDEYLDINGIDDLSNIINTEVKEIKSTYPFKIVDQNDQRYLIIVCGPDPINLDKVQGLQLKDFYISKNLCSEMIRFDDGCYYKWVNFLNTRVI